MNNQIDLISLNDLIILLNIEINEIHNQIEKLKKLQLELDNIKQNNIKQNNIKQNKKSSKKVKKIIIEI